MSLQKIENDVLSPSVYPERDVRDTMIKTLVTLVSADAEFCAFLVLMVTKQRQTIDSQKEIRRKEVMLSFTQRR